jgi:hypothetical protein
VLVRVNNKINKQINEQNRKKIAIICETLIVEEGVNGGSISERHFQKSMNTPRLNNIGVETVTY